MISNYCLFQNNDWAVVKQTKKYGYKVTLGGILVFSCSKYNLVFWQNEVAGST